MIKIETLKALLAMGVFIVIINYILGMLMLPDIKGGAFFVALVATIINLIMCATIPSNE